MTHDQLVHLASVAVKDVFDHESVDKETRIVALTEIKDDIRGYLEILESEEDDDDA